MRVLVAPDKFRGTLTAAQAASAIAAGWRRARRSDEVVELPLADGGEGTLDALVAALSGRTAERTVTGPLGDPIAARYGLIAGGRAAVVELARASGLGLVAERRRRPLDATTRGTGELILEACRRGAREILVCVGGSASTDGGAGLAASAGARLLDRSGRPIPDGGAALLELSRIDLSALDPAVRVANVVALCDVTNPLTGPSGSARVFGPQKGASSEDVALLDRALAHFVAVVRRDVGIDLREVRGAGAAGGAAGGLVALLGARIRPGAPAVLDAVGFDGELERADLVVTGEGRLDATSLAGKVPGAVLEAAARRETQVAILCGEATFAVDAEVRSLVETFGRRRALEDARSALEELAERTARERGPISSRT
jgi:glycerate kinase